MANNYCHIDKLVKILNKVRDRIVELNLSCIGMKDAGFDHLVPFIEDNTVLKKLIINTNKLYSEQSAQ